MPKTENRKIGIIVNPFSRVNIRTNCASVEEFRKIGGDLVDVRATRSLEELDKVATEFRKKNYSYIGISGGDGTIHNVLTRLINAYPSGKLPPVLLLSDGTMNNISTSVGLRKKSDILLKTFVEGMKNAKPVRIIRRDTMKIGKSYCFIFGFGFTTNFLNAVYSGNKKGFMKNLEVLLKTLGQIINNSISRKKKEIPILEPVNAEIRIDGEKIHFKKIVVVLAGTVEMIGMGFKALYRANDCPKTFHSIITGMRPIDIIKEYSNVRYGRRIDNDLHIDEIVTKMEIQSEGNFEYTMDGDMYTAEKKLLVETGPTVDFIYIE